jgi:subtilase family serine protease
MTSVRSWAALASVGLAVGAATVASGTPASASATVGGRAMLAGSLTPSSERSKPAGHVASGSQVKFDLVLNLRDAAGAEAMVKAVSTPGSAQYRHYLTDAQWIARFAPTQASVASAETWLRAQGFKVGTVPSDRLFIAASGSAAQVQAAFSTTLSEYTVNGHQVRLANSSLSVPASLSGAVSGVVGVNQGIASNDLSQNFANVPATAPTQEPAPPASFANPKPCSAYFNQKPDTTDKAALYKPYSSPLDYDICGYKPGQLQSAYGLSSQIAAGTDGSGVTIAIVDAYDAPTLLKDAQHYFNLNDPSQPLTSSQFKNDMPASVGNEDVCGASGWFAEQSLDVESSHSMAPGANITFVGAEDCFDSSLLAAENTAIGSGASVVSNSWGDVLGDLLVDAASKTAFDNTFELADATGVSILYSSGDAGDNFADFGIAAPDYPPSSPLVTAVGGTSLEVGSTGNRAAELGWSTGKSILCGPVSVKNCGSSTTVVTPLGFNSGGGAGTSYTYLQPSYQAGVVPAALALRNQALFGPQPLRVVPDISMDADAQTGMLIGLTQTFPNGSTHYGQFKEGGTSLASPLLAGVIADADQAAGGSIGFLNPTLYSVDTSHPQAFRDILPPVHPNAAAVIRVDYANTQNAANGYNISLRVLDYEGLETYCDATGNCASRDVSVWAAPGFDGITGIGSVSSQFVKLMAAG